MWKRYFRNIESQEVAYLVPAVPVFPANFKKILGAVFEIGPNCFHVIFINSDIFFLLAIWKFISINVKIDFVWTRPFRMIANTAEPGLAVYSPRQNKLGSRERLVELLVHQRPREVFKTVVLFCEFQQLFMAIVDPLSETLARPCLVFQAKMFEAGTEGRGPGFVKTDSKDLHARSPEHTKSSWKFRAICLLA